MPDLQATEIPAPPVDALPSERVPHPWGRDLLVGLAVLLVAFAPTVASLPMVWWEQEGYVQGFLLAPFVAYLLWRDRDQLVPPGPLAPSELAIVLLGGSGVWLASQIMSVQAGAQLMFLVILTGWGLYVLGLRSWPVVLPLAATLLLAVPVLDTFIPVLREMAVVMSGLFVRLLRIPAEIQGDLIIIETGSFVIENGCAGHAYLMVGLTMGAVYSHLFMRGWKTRLGVVALAGAVALLSNWIRITHLVWIGYSSQMQSPTITDHVVHGWIVFSIALVPFFFLARRMERWNAPRSVAGGSDANRAEDRVPAVDAWRRRLALATGVAAGGPVLFYLGSILPSAEARDVPIAPAGSEWVEAAPGGAPDASPSATPDWQIAYAGVDRREESRWVREGDEGLVVGQRLIYERQRQGSELINSLNRIAPASMVARTRTVGPLDASGTTLQETWVRTDEQAWLVWHRYRVAGIATASSARAKLLELVAFVTRRRQAELVTLAAPCGPESCETAARELFHFFTGRELPSEGEGPSDSGAGEAAPSEGEGAPAGEPTAPVDSSG